MTCPDKFDGLRILVVEDNYFIAADLALHIESCDAEVIGPARNVREALALIEQRGSEIEVASLDVNLGSERVFPVADALLARGIPFIFSTGYDMRVIPDSYDAPRLQKPIDADALMKQLAELVRPHEDGDPPASGSSDPEPQSRQCNPG